MRSFFTPPKVRQFNLKPCYYSEEKERIEELKRRIGADAAEEEERSDRMRQAFNRRRTRGSKPNKLLTGSRLLVYALLLVMLVMMLSNARFLLF